MQVADEVVEEVIGGVQAVDHHEQHLVQLQLAECVGAVHALLHEVAHDLVHHLAHRAQLEQDALQAHLVLLAQVPELHRVAFANIILVVAQNRQHPPLHLQHVRHAAAVHVLQAVHRDLSGEGAQLGDGGVVEEARLLAVEVQVRVVEEVVVLQIGDIAVHPRRRRYNGADGRQRLDGSFIGLGGSFTGLGGKEFGGGDGPLVVDVVRLLGKAHGGAALALFLRVGEGVDGLELPPLVLDDEEGLAGVVRS